MDNSVSMTSKVPLIPHPASPNIDPGTSFSLRSPDEWNPDSSMVTNPYSSSLSIPRSVGLISSEPDSTTDEVGQDGDALQRTHLTVYEIASTFPDAHLLIPQSHYLPHTQSDRRHYVDEVELKEPIMFYMHNPDGLGIPCRDALNVKFARLAGRDDTIFVNCGLSVSIRLMVSIMTLGFILHQSSHISVLKWPGYPSWSRQIPTCDFRSPPGPATRSKIAKNVSKTVQRFIEVSYQA